MKLKFGVVSEAKAGYARVLLPGEDGIVTDWLPVVVPFALTDKACWQLPVSTQVCCVMDEYLDDGAVVGALYNNIDTPPNGINENIFRIVFSDNTLIEYNKSTHELKADVKGKVTIVATGKIKAQTTADIEAIAATTAKVQAPAITLQGNVTVIGTLSAGAIACAPISGVAGATGNSVLTGNLSVDGAINAHGDVVADTVSLQHHKHGGVQTGGGLTSEPV